MKKKSLLMTIVAFTALGLVGCNNKPTPSVSDQPATETPTSTVNTNDDTITRRGNTTFEVNQTATFRFNVTSAIRNKTVNVEIDNPNVAGVSLTSGDVDDHANSVSNVKLLGIEPGTINRKVTSVETGNSKTFVLTVIAAKPTLKEALTALASAKNYTFTGAPEDESLKNNVTTTITKRVEKALTVTDGKQGNLWTSKAIDDKDADYYARYGIAVNSKNQAFYIDKNRHIDTENEKVVTDENFRSSAILAVSSSQGFLDGDNFAGDSEAFGSYLFNSFSLINPAWGPSTKADDNIYEIAGGTSETDESTYLAILECRLWNRVDPSGMISNRQAKKVYTYVDAASWIDTSVEVIDATDIKITITPVQGAGLTRIVAEGSSKEASYPAMVGTISNVGSTVLDSDIRNYLVTDIKVQNPGRNAAKKARKAAFSADSYTYTEPIQYDYTKDGKKAYGTVYRYWHYTKNYVFLEVPEASKTQYQADTGNAWGSDDTTKKTGENIGYGIAKDGKVHELSYVAEAGSVAAHVEVGDVLKGQTSSGATQEVTLNARTEFAPSGYFVDGGFGALLDASGALYRLSDEAAPFWGGDSTPYYNNYRSNSNCYDAFGLFFFGITGAQLEQYLERNDLTYFTLINTETASDGSVTAFNIQLDARYTDGKYYRGSRLDFSLKDIGSAKSTYDTLITSALAA